MFTNPEQFATATKALFEFQLMTFNTLTSKAVQGVEQVLALNMATAKSGIEDGLAASKEISQAKDPKAAMAAAAAQLQPGVAGAKAYKQQLDDIIKEIHTEFTTAAEAHVAEAKSNLSALIYDVTKNVPPGSENAVAIVKAAIDNAFLGYEQVTKATKQAVKTVEEQIAKASAQVAQATEKATGGATAAAEKAAPAAKPKAAKK
ncbi:MULTISPECIES: TIGR01841 family phasin [Janthinobacterium]|uniref:TIGR01841 family phasin n=1 Tax=Janthinobacterium kumbetense TaxID=2950280 RepID=A0ABT0WZS7_9BURK|nr:MULTISPECIES: TIGR01841 family phasin [Janthinobacterium]AQR68782.1 phasin family protein [Janthinobacterium sp. LM6]MCM2569074.1 TIGR01841 family phasin [Janthinobacterium kumbetense]MDN2674219.1 TIGR01841 family phasin [Janthinobacterium sp. SUN026]MDN2703092.1 TIGR01841 family phasin [Janthinobacterium sp. SUN100]MDN2715043.1 TIGR01841 family phasin [Janthinobacterium sp. SUN120]